MCDLPAGFSVTGRGAFLGKAEQHAIRVAE